MTLSRCSRAVSVNACIRPRHRRARLTTRARIQRRISVTIWALRLRAVCSALGGDVPASHKGHHFGRRTHQAGAIEPGCRRVKLLTLETVERVIVTLRSAAHPAVALLWGDFVPGGRDLQFTTGAAGVHT